MSSEDAIPRPATRASAGPPSSSAWATLGVVTLGSFLLALDLTIVNVALPSLRTSLDANFADLQWVIDAYALTLAALLLTAGSLADRFGRKAVYNGGFALFTVASLLCGLAWDTNSIILARAAQGIGAAVLFAVGPALIGQVFRGKSRGVAFSVFGGGLGLGLAMGPLIGGALTDGVGWRLIFLINVPVGLVCLALGLAGIQDHRDPLAHRVDTGGLVTFSVALGLLVLSLLRGELDGWSSPRIVGGLVVSALMLAAFVVIEMRRGPAAMLDLSLLKNRTFLTASAVALLMTATSMSAFFLMISYMQNVLGLSPWETGQRFLWLTVALFLAAGVGGILTSRVPFRVIIGLGAAFLAAGLVLIEVMVDVDSTWSDLIPSMVLMGIGIGLYNPARAAISIAVTEPRRAGMASGINETFQQAGWAIGIAGVGALFQSRVSDHFLDSAAAQALGPEAEGATEAVSAGSIDTVVGAAPPAVADQVSEAARSAFVNGFTDVSVVVAVLSVITAVIAFAFITNRDLDESAIGLPGALPEYDDDNGTAADTATRRPPPTQPVPTSAPVG